MAADELVLPTEPASLQAKPVIHAKRKSWPTRADGRRGKNNRGKSDKKGQKSDGSQKGGDKESWQRSKIERANKRRKVIDEVAGGSSYASINFTAEEIAAEDRRPKRKVAVLIGYAGTGYHGLQINHKEKSIEGELFAAFVATGAISKANADDPKKTSLMRCARTDKGVHAAGNVLSLKLIVDDAQLVNKVNRQLPPQIRVWGIQRTANSFSAYQACESRWYEYLLPSYALLPPHPASFLGKKIAEFAEKTGKTDEVAQRMDDVQGLWNEVDKNCVQPILDRLEPGMRAEVMKLLREEDTHEPHDGPANTCTGEEGAIEKEAAPNTSHQDPKDVLRGATPAEEAAAGETAQEAKEPTPVQRAVRDIRAAQVAAKRRYRVTPARLQKLQSALDRYLGTNNFHNYTVMKKASDPSAKRHIKFFVVNTTPIAIRDTEWLSLKVHGQSFMMHQIRKMVAMAVMVVRCGAPVELIGQSYGPRRISIPKAPGLGLLLERPMFTGYNAKAVKELGRDPLDFSKYEAEMDVFKDREIYSRMFEVEEKTNAFHSFFHQLDNFRTDYFLWVTAGGIDAAYERADRGERVPKGLEAELGDDADGVDETST